MRDLRVNERDIVSFRLKLSKILRIDIQGIGSLLVESRNKLSVFRYSLFSL
jgi:hypothetical protein